jgi:hypothetical protein
MKRISAKVYRLVNSSLQYVATWDGFEISGFAMSLDGGLGECSITLAKGFGASGPDFAEGNTVIVSVCDADTLARDETAMTEVLYRGRISEVVRETGRNVVIRLMGEQSRLAQDFLRSGSQTTLYSKTVGGITATVGDQSAADVGLMARAVIDLHKTNNPLSPIHYLEGDIPDMSATATYTFEAMTVKEALDALKGMVAGCHWFIDATGRVTFGTTARAAHSLTFGREITSARLTKSAGMKIVNSWLVWDGTAGGTYKRYEDANSIARFERSMDIYTDAGIKTSATADSIGARLLAETKDPSVKLVAEVIDGNGDANGYDIESLRPGDTVRLLNFDADVAEWTFNDSMIITDVEWAKDKAIIHVDIVPSGLIASQKNQAVKVNSLELKGIKTTFS